MQKIIENKANNSFKGNNILATKTALNQFYHS